MGTFEFFWNFLEFLKISFWKKRFILKLLISSYGKVLGVMGNLVMKISEIRNVTWFFLNIKIFFRSWNFFNMYMSFEEIIKIQQICGKKSNILAICRILNFFVEFWNSKFEFCILYVEFCSLHIKFWDSKFEFCSFYIEFWNSKV